MVKKLILLTLLFLTGCGRNSVTSCTFSKDKAEVNLDIKAINDDISSIKVRTSFEIPSAILADRDKYDFILSQVDDSYHFENNYLINEYNIALDDKYSLELTKDHLKHMRFYCE